jgi:glycine cleavage system transcriptional repressor
MIQYIISITAQDRPGIVAGVSEAVLALKGNIEAASQTVHQGYFAMILLCTFSEGVTKEDVISWINAQAGSDLHVFAILYQEPPRQPDSPIQHFIVTARGPDKPGILHALSSYLASKNINIDDLYACVEGGDFVVICQVSVPAALDVYMLQTDLEAAGESLGLSLNMQHENIFTATNELRFGRVF